MTAGPRSGKGSTLTESYHLREYVAQMAVGQDSPLVGPSMREAGLEERFSIEVVGPVRNGHRAGWLGEQTIQAGDLLLVHGRGQELMELEDLPGLRLKAQVELCDEALASGEVVPAEAVVAPNSHVVGRTVRREGLWPAPAIMTAVAGLAGAGVLPILVSVRAGVAAMIATGCRRMQEAYDAVDRSVIFLLAGMIPLGAALEQTGAARLVADGVLARLGGLGPWVLLSVFHLLTSLMTEPMSNNVTAILLTPVAAAVADELGVDPRPFLVAIAFAASASFMTPLGYQTNAMVYGPGDYRYTDYVKPGGPLNVLSWIPASLLIPVFWPFR